MELLNKNNEKGEVAILLTLLVMCVIFLIVFGISAIILNELKSSRAAGQSTPAYYAAETGVEALLYEVVKMNVAYSCNTLSPAPLSATAATFACALVNTNDYKFTGSNNNNSTQRAIEVKW